MNKSLAASEADKDEHENTHSHKPWGIKLRQVRESRNLTIEDIAAELRLEIPLLNAIESENVDALPSAPFVKGYIRNYARFLEINDHDLIAAYNELGVGDASGIRKLGPGNETTSNHVGVRYISWGIIAIVIVGFIFWLGREMTSSATKKETPRNEVTAPAVQPIPTSTLLPETLDVGEIEETPADESAVVERMNTSLPDTPVEENVAPEVMVESEPVVSNSEPTPLATVALRFSEDSWVEISDATGERLFVNIGQADTEKVVQGVPPFSVLLGKASVVTVQYNGQPYEVAKQNRKGVARFTLGEAASE